MVVGLREEPPSQTKQLIHFKRGLQDCIKSKMEIRQYANIADMIQQAQLVEEDCLNEHQGEFNAGLTRGMFRQSSNNPTPLGIHDADENREVLTANNLSKQDQGGVKDEFCSKYYLRSKACKRQSQVWLRAILKRHQKKLKIFRILTEGNPSIHQSKEAGLQRSNEE